MSFTPIFASDTSAAVGWYVSIPVYAGLLGLGSILVNFKWGKRRWWGLAIGLIPTVIGVLAFILEILFATLGTGGLYIFWAIAAFPLICGVCSLYLWRR